MDTDIIVAGQLISQVTMFLHDPGIEIFKVQNSSQEGDRDNLLRGLPVTISYR
jgi:hypothetical protein